MLALPLYNPLPLAEGHWEATGVVVSYCHYVTSGDLLIASSSRDGGLGSVQPEPSIFHSWSSLSGMFLHAVL